MGISSIDVYYFVFQAEDAERRAKNLEDAKKITIEEDASLPAAKLVSFQLILCVNIFVLVTHNMK